MYGDLIHTRLTKTRMEVSFCVLTFAHSTEMPAQRNISFCRSSQNFVKNCQILWQRVQLGAIILADSCPKSSTSVSYLISSRELPEVSRRDSTGLSWSYHTQNVHKSVCTWDTFWLHSWGLWTKTCWLRGDWRAVSIVVSALGSIMGVWLPGLS